MRKTLKLNQGERQDHSWSLVYYFSIIADYLVWNVIPPLMGYLPDKFMDAALILEKVESGITKLDKRWLRCIRKADGAFGFASGALYVQDYFAESSKAEVIMEEEKLKIKYMYVYLYEFSQQYNNKP